ncbi:transcriptional regulator [Candidatus Woesearchaeota archaeon]|nr:transcriptional regulator [Candidatus Woesearchaeota archaeon]
MVELMPQEIEVWYIIPAVRKELVKAMRSMGLQQKEIAAKLGITEPAVSQYLGEKRGSEVKFGKTLQLHIGKEAEKIVNGSRSPMEVIHDITSMLGVKKIMCDLHRGKSKKIQGKCDICFK